jgi:hypothetical protein
VEMMDIRAAIQVLDNYSLFLEGTRKIVSKYIESTSSDPEIIAQRALLQEDLKELWRDSTIASIALCRHAVQQAHLLTNYPADVAALTNAQTRHQVELNATTKILLKIDPTCFDQKEIR